MKLLQDLDLYKVIIIVSLLLLPVVGGWSYWLQGELEAGRTALYNATKREGDLEEIGKFQKAVEEQMRSNLTQQSGPDNFNVYFQQCIFSSVSQGGEGTRGLRGTDFSITPKGVEAAGPKAEDQVVSITWKRGGKDPMPLSRSFLLAVLFNCESSSPIWKLRELSIKNADPALQQGRAKAPPPELEDSWLVTSMVFGSRQPRSGRD
jgi:hypothetical protein